MRVAVLVYKTGRSEEVRANLLWADTSAGQVQRSISVPISPNLGLFPTHGCLLVSYTESPQESSPKEWLDVYRLPDGNLSAHLPMDCRAQFNGCPEWPTFVASPDPSLIYVYKTRTLGDHWAEDFVCGLDLTTMQFAPWNFKIPECVAGWSASGSRVHAQMLFVADGIEVGKLPSGDLGQKVAFWLGPEEGMGPMVSLGPRPRAHSDLGHARAILFAPKRCLSVVVCTDGVTHLIDPTEFRYVERQQVEFTKGYAMPIFAAQIDPAGRFLYVGTARDKARHFGLIERVIVYNLERGAQESVWVLEDPLGGMALSEDGSRLCGVSPGSNKLWVLDAHSGQVQAMELDGSPQYVVPVDGVHSLPAMYS